MQFNVRSRRRHGPRFLWLDLHNIDMIIETCMTTIHSINFSPSRTKARVEEFAYPRWSIWRYSIEGFFFYSNGETGSSSKTGDRVMEIYRILTLIHCCQVERVKYGFVLILPGQHVTYGKRSMYLYTRAASTTWEGGVSHQKLIKTGTGSFSTFAVTPSGQLDLMLVSVMVPSGHNIRPCDFRGRSIRPRPPRNRSFDSSYLLPDAPNPPTPSDFLYPPVASGILISVFCFTG